MEKLPEDSPETGNREYMISWVWEHPGVPGSMVQDQSAPVMRNYAVGVGCSLWGSGGLNRDQKAYPKMPSWAPGRAGLGTPLKKDGLDSGWDQ